MRVTYSHNNSGGRNWLRSVNWKALEDAGWKLGYFTNPKPGDDPYQATGVFDSIDDAIAKWEELTGQTATDSGCECCGPPHDFYEAWRD